AAAKRSEKGSSKEEGSRQAPQEIRQPIQQPHSNRPDCTERESGASGVGRMEQRALGNILSRHGVASPDALEPLYAQQREKDASLLELMVQAKAATDVDIARALAAECGLPFVEKIAIDEVPTQLATRLPIGYARNHRLLVTAETDDGVHVVCADPLDVDGLDDVRAAFGKPVHARVATPSVVIDAINRVYERQETMSELESDERREDEDQVDLLDSDEDAPIIRWVNGLFSQ